MSSAPANTTVPKSTSSEKYAIIDELQKMEKRLVEFIKDMIQHTFRETCAMPVEANNSWQEDEPSPLSVNILSVQMPPNVTSLLLDKYTGRSDPFYHIAQFEAAISLKNLTGPQKCRLLHTTLKDIALQWFSNLPVGSITTYVDFKKKLLDRFVSAKKRLRMSYTLFDVMQGPTESLKSYVDRFLQSTTDIQDFEPVTAQLALTHGIRDTNFRHLLQTIPPKSFDNMLDMLNYYIDKWPNDSMPFTDNINRSEEEEKHQRWDGPRVGSGLSQKVYTIFVRGFDKSLGLDEIQRKLEEHFGSCGKITNVSLPKRYPGVSKGFGFIDFEDFNAFSMALKLDCSALGGHVLTVQEESPRRPNPRRGGGSCPGFGGTVTTEELALEEAIPGIVQMNAKKYKVTGLSGVVYSDSE